MRVAQPSRARLRRVGAGREYVLVGATSGIGRRVAEQLSAAGHQLVLAGRDPARAAALAERLPGATVLTADVSGRAGLEQLVAGVAERVGQIDVLINNAGVMTPVRQEGTDGIELNLAVHHLAPWSKSPCSAS